MKLPSHLVVLLFLLNLMQSAHAACDLPKAAALISQGVHVSQQVQKDYGRQALSSNCYLEAWPENTTQLAALVKIAYANHIAIRTQGAAHSANGNSLPQTAELQIHTTRLNKVSFLPGNVIRVSAGVPILLLQQFINSKTSFLLPVANGGRIGPTIGGYISSGGISFTSGSYGGIWEHVQSITLVIANGNIITVKRNDPMFLYLFGSMGQLGIIAEVNLALLPVEGKFYIYPQGLTETLAYPSTNGLEWAKPEAIKPDYWFNLFVPANRAYEAQADLKQLAKQYPHALQTIVPYQWPVSFISSMPPLVYDKAQTFVDVGIMAPLATLPDSQAQLQQMEMAFSKLVLDKHYRRYLQAERYEFPSFYEAYYSAETLRTFKQFKQQVDPAFLFNRGSFFSGH